MTDVELHTLSLHGPAKKRKLSKFDKFRFIESLGQLREQYHGERLSLHYNNHGRVKFECKFCQIFIMNGKYYDFDKRSHKVWVRDQCKLHFGGGSCAGGLISLSDYSPKRLVTLPVAAFLWPSLTGERSG